MKARVFHVQKAFRNIIVLSIKWEEQMTNFQRNVLDKSCCKFLWLCCNPLLFFVFFSPVSARIGTNVWFHHSTPGLSVYRHAEGLFMVWFCAACGLWCVCSWSRGRCTVIHTLSRSCLKKAYCGYGQKPMCGGALAWLLSLQHKPSEEKLRTEGLLSRSAGAKTQNYTSFPSVAMQMSLFSVVEYVLLSLRSAFLWSLFTGLCSRRGKSVRSLSLQQGTNLTGFFHGERKWEKKGGWWVSTRHLVHQTNIEHLCRNEKRWQQIIKSKAKVNRQRPQL